MYAEVLSTAVVDEGLPIILGYKVNLVEYAAHVKSGVRGNLAGWAGIKPALLTWPGTLTVVRLRAQNVWGSRFRDPRSSQ